MDAVRPTRRSSHAAVWLGAAAALGVFTAVWLASLSSTSDLAANAASLAHTLLTATWPAGLFLLTALGIGRLARRVFTSSDQAYALQMGIGLALLLTLIHLLGMFGLLTTPIAIGVCAVGCVLAIDQFVRTRAADVSRGVHAPGRTITPWLLVLAAPIAVLAVAAASAPGWVWDSEFGAYDALSYHFQLPQEWHRAGRIAPLEHNIYSYLPSSMESAYTFIAALTNAPIDGPAGHGLAAGTGWRLLACHYLHASLALVTAWMLGAFVRARLSGITSEPERPRPGAPDDQRAHAAGFWTAAALTLATPWVVVVGSMGYNELAVTALGAAAMLAASDRNLGPITRSALAGLLVGGACGCKPTALFLVTPVVGVLLLDTLPARARLRSLPRLILPACAAGLIMLSPWLIRNATHGGNPVLPQMTSVFGNAHWTQEQTERYQRAHKDDASIAQRLRLLAWTDPSAEPDAPPVERFRGATNLQWGVLFPAGIGLGAVLLIAPTTRRDASVLLAGLALQLLAWVFLTHLQSRFLLPCVLPLAALVGIRAGACDRLRARAFILTIVLMQTGLLAWVYADQHGRNPSGGLPVEPAMYAGRPYSTGLGDAFQQAWINNNLDENSRVYLLGDATPLYYDRPVVYNTTWDAWAIGDAIRSAPDDPSAWVAALREHGITHVLIAPTEVARLHASGWADPAVTPEQIGLFVRTLGEPVKRWDHASRFLYRLTNKPRPSGSGPAKP